MAAAGQFEYGIEMLLQAIRLAPANLEIHEELREVALQRKAAGGADLGYLEKVKLNKSGADAVESVLKAEKLLAYDPGNTDCIVAALRAARAAELDAVAAWLERMLKRTSE